VDAIICAAGGWAGGSAGADPTAFAKSVQDMVSQCLLPPMLATSMAAHLMNDGGALVIVGSAAALRPTPGMIAYGAVKAATHHIVHSAAAEGSGLPKGSRVLGIIPTTIDTPSNRKWMAGADVSTWTSTADIADKVLSFAQRTEAPPVSSGSLLEPVTFSSRTVWHEHSLA
ncbi:SDR family NAD(P)-dependent oxidoreductase, partial [archaeon]